MALGRKTGGRKKGTPNKRLKPDREAAEAGGVMPLEVMLTVMRDLVEKGENIAAAAIAKDAAPYLHARIAPKNTDGTDPVTHLKVSWEM
jgi:hypothetical protein